MILIVCAGAFYTGSSQPSQWNPHPNYPQNQTYIGINFFSSINNFVSTINELGTAIQQIVPAASSLDVGGLSVAAAGSGIAVIKILIGIPMLISSFIYDLVRLLFFFLPAVAPPELMVVISIIVLIPIIAILMELASAVKPPGLAKW